MTDHSTPYTAADLSGDRLRVLHVEDSDDDAALVVRALRREGYALTYRRVDSPSALQQALAEGPWDLVMADYEVPGFGGLAALEIVQRHGLDVPFLIVSGAIGEETAVAAMKAGAHDYIMKGNLARLVPAIERELRDAAIRRERRRLEEEQAILLEIATSISGILDLGDILGRAHRRIASLLPCERVLTYAWDATAAVFHLQREYGVPEEMRADVTVVEALPGELGADWMLRTHAAVVNRADGQPALARAWLDRLGCSAFVGTPLLVAGTVTGALVAVRTAPGAVFHAHEVALFDNIARQIALVMGAATMYRTIEAQARVSNALARTGHALISALDTPRLIDRLSHVTAEVLQCDWSVTLLWEPKQDAYVPVSSFGCSPEEWEALQVLAFAHSQLAGLLDRLDREAVMGARAQALEPLTELPLHGPVTTAACLALRRGGEIIGIQCAGYRGAAGQARAVDEQIATGITGLASLALENARLVEKLASANRLKADFMATMSHELRTPLHIILGYAQLLVEEAFGPLGGEQASTLLRMQHSARELLDLVDATLDVGRLETGRMPLDLAEVDLGALAGEIRSEMAEVSDNPDVAVVWDVAEGLPPVHSDHLKLKVILKNLLSNAIKFTPHGQVVVSIGARSGGVEITVTDTGVGIAADVLPTVFEPFRQGKYPRTDAQRGVGLGLYIVKRLVTLLRGTIAVRSQEGAGSTFTVWLPRDAAAEPIPGA